MNIRESDHIEDILKYLNQDEKYYFCFDFDDTLIKINSKYYVEAVGPLGHIGTDAWFGHVLKHAMQELKDNAILAFIFTTTINDSLQDFIHVKAAEKKTIAVLNHLKAKEIPVMIVTARGFTLARRTKEQLEEANITINEDWLKVESQEDPLILPLKYDFHYLSHLPDQLNQLAYRFSYVYIEETQQLFYFNRQKEAEEVKIKNDDFQKLIMQMLDGRTQKKISKEEICLLLNEHQPEEHSVVYHKGILYCEGQNKGEALNAFFNWAKLNANLNEGDHTFFVDDRLDNIRQVETEFRQTEKKFSGMHYRRIKRNFDFETSSQELKNLYPYLPVKIRKALIEIKLSENHSSFFQKKSAVNKVDDEELLASNELKNRRV